MTKDARFEADEPEPGEPRDPRRAGFWIRASAYFVDLLAIYAVQFAMAYTVYGYRPLSEMAEIKTPFIYAVTYLVPTVYTIGFWCFMDATPGKRLLRLRIVHKGTRQRPAWWRYVIRYIAYTASYIVFLLGFFWIGWDRNKEGWHDKIAGTRVIRV